MFDENKLREEIARVWGEYGVHMEVYDMLLKRAQVKHELITAQEALNELENTYTREQCFLVAKRSTELFIRECLLKDKSRSDEIINSEIDTLNLF